MCNIWKQPSKEEPSLEQIEGFFKENHSFLRGLKFIQLTGGEPFLRDDLPEIVKIVHEAAPNCMIWIPTNGLLPEKILDITASILDEMNQPLLGVTVSLDGDAPTNDKQRGIEGSFIKDVRTIKNLSTLQELGLKLSTEFTLTAENYVYAPIIQRMVYRLGSDFSLRPVNFSEHYYKNTSQKVESPSQKALNYLDYVAFNLRQKKGWLASITNLVYL